LLPAATVRPDDCSQLIRSRHTCSNLTIRHTPWGIGKPEDTGLRTTDRGRNGFVGGVLPTAVQSRLEFASGPASKVE
jgi:hypothetical protein